MSATLQQRRPDPGSDSQPFDRDTAHPRFYLVYRVALGVALLLVYFGIGRGPLGNYSPQVFTAAVHLYLATAILGLVAHLRGVGDTEKQAQLAVFLDIALITVMMHASGGVQSGLGMLIAVSIALGSLGLGGHTALLFAAYVLMIPFGLVAWRRSLREQAA